MSAVATVLSLLLLTSLIATYILGPLPQQESTNEFNHQLLLENQLSQLQASLIAENNATGPALTQSTPITLGSEPVPPFGPGARGELDFQPSVSGPVLNEQLEMPSVTSLGWGSGDLCSGGFSHNSCGQSSSGACHPPLGYNYSGSNQSVSFSISGSTDCAYLNISGSHDVISFQASGSSLAISLTVLGTYNYLNVQLSGSSDKIALDLYGHDDTYNLTSSGSSDVVNTLLVGENPSYPTSCPDGNLSSTSDQYSISQSGSSNTENYTWYNSVGYSTGYHSGSSGSNTVGFKNVSGSIGCAFTVEKLVVAPTYGLGDLTVKLDNNYLPTVYLGFEGGGVFIGSADGQSQVALRPPIYFTSTSAGKIARLILFDLVGSPIQTEGTSTLALDAQLVNAFHSRLAVGNHGNSTILEPVLNITTEFPEGWMNFLNSSSSSYFSGSVSCTAIGHIVTPFSCLDPPPGHAVLLSVKLNVNYFFVTYDIVDLTLG